MDNYLVIETKLDTKNFDAEIEYVEKRMEEIEYKIKQADMGFEVGDVQKLEAEYSRLGKKLSTLVKKQQQLNKVDLSNATKKVNSIGNSVSRTIKKVARWSLAIFGIRSAYNLLRNAMSTISEYNEQLASDVEYIKYSLATALEPIMQKIINLVYILLQYVNYLSKAWFNVDLFSNASASNMKNANKQAKDLKKTMSSFDEMNVLTDNSSSTTTSNPSVDLTTGNVQTPEWLVFLKNNGAEIGAILLGFATSLKLIELGFETIKSLGIGLLVAGFALAIKGIIDFIKDPSWQNFLTILEGISLVIAGIAVLTGNWLVVAVALGVALVSLIVKNWETIKQTLSKVASWIYDNVIAPIKNRVSGLWEHIKSGFKGFINTIINGLNTLINGLNKISFNIPSWVPLIGGKKWGFSLKEIPKLAKGGIINMPGRGVPVGSAIAGERGAEGVIPLTDSQQMALLGEAIGKYITINANITNTMNGRVISRELQKVQSSSNFALNS